MGRNAEGNIASTPSSNWLALQKKLTPTSSSPAVHIRKKRKLSHTPATMEPPIAGARSFDIEEKDFTRGPQSGSSTSNSSGPSIKNGESLILLRKMIDGDIALSEGQQEPGKYLAMDCEMVGVGIDGQESSLARVSLVNYYGVVQMDEFVKQRERVVDYRTQFSGVRPKDMINATPFHLIQQRVSELIKDRIVVGHAIHNDFKALLLSHPRQLTRDTQVLASKYKITKSRRPALRNLVKQELDVVIQEGEHSSVTDARATMAVYRLHRKKWDSGFPALDTVLKKRKVGPTEHRGQGGVASADKGSTNAERLNRPQPETFPGGGQKGVSSGLSTVVARKGKRGGPGFEDTEGSEWWKELGEPNSGSKGSMKFKVML